MIKKIRLEKGMTQKELGEKCGLADSAIRRYELGGANPKLETLKKIADALDVATISFIDFDKLRELNRQEVRLGLDGMELGLVLQDIHDFLKEDEYELLLQYYKLNDEGKTEAIKRVNELTEIKRYQSTRNILIPENRERMKQERVKHESLEQKIQNAQPRTAAHTKSDQTKEQE